MGNVDESTSTVFFNQYTVVSHFRTIKNETDLENAVFHRSKEVVPV